jgi:repressor LexA
MKIEEKARDLRAFFQREHRMPSYSEMMSLFRYRSKNAVFGLVAKLEERGLVSRTAGKIALTNRAAEAVRILGAVHAGFPSPAEEELLDTINLERYLVEHPDRTFMLRVSGDSMLDAGIHPGDMVLVEKGATPKQNDIVIAQVDGEWTMKYFFRDRDGVRLDPANRKYRPIRPRQSMEIGGVVRSVIRKYS